MKMCCRTNKVLFSLRWMRGRSIDPNLSSEKKALCNSKKKGLKNFQKVHHLYSTVSKNIRFWSHSALCWTHLHDSNKLFKKDKSFPKLMNALKRFVIPTDMYFHNTFQAWKSAVLEAEIKIYSKRQGRRKLKEFFCMYYSVCVLVLHATGCLEENSNLRQCISRLCFSTIPVPPGRSEIA